MKTALHARAGRLVDAGWFEWFILAVIAVNAVGLGLEIPLAGNPVWSALLATLNTVCIGIFVIEMLVRLMAHGRSFFRSGWNVFDLVVVALALFTTGGAFSSLRAVRAFRAVRVTRLFSRFRPLRQIISSILHALPSIGWTVLVMVVVYYMYAVIGISLFAERSPERFAGMGAAFGTLFELTTLEGWQDIVTPLVAVQPWAWLYFGTFILVASFILLNVILGIVVASLDMQNDVEEREVVQAAMVPGASATEVLRAEVLRLRDQVEHVTQLVEIAAAEPGQSLPSSSCAKSQDPPHHRVQL